MWAPSQRKFRRRWLLLGKSGRRPPRFGGGPVHRTGPDPSRQSGGAGSPRTHPKRLSARDRMRRKLRTKRGRQRYAPRMETVEPVFGQIKQGRGFRQFPLRTLEKVNREWLLICAGHNLLKLFRFGGWLAGKVLGSGPTRDINESPGTVSASILGRLSGHSRLTPARIAVAN